MIDLETSLKRMGVDIAWKDLHQGSLHHVAIYKERIHKGARGHTISMRIWSRGYAPRSIVCITDEIVYYTT